MTMEEAPCPVCGMDTADSDWCVQHGGVNYRFCSTQCRENFRARPSLYVGRNSATGSGRSIIKQRAFALAQALDHVQQIHLKQDITRLMGIRDLEVKADAVTITYDLLEVSAKQIEQALTKAGVSLGTGWSSRLKRGWIHYSEENELDNLAAGASPCCNKPPAKG